MRLQGRTALVTGAASGFGQGIAQTGQHLVACRVAALVIDAFEMVNVHQQHCQVPALVGRLVCSAQALHHDL